jgi:hypothetical protein
VNQLPPASACPWCATPFERVTDAAKLIDWSEGDILVCIRCANVGVFTHQLTIRQVTNYELRAIRTAEPEIFADIDRKRIKIREINANERRQAARDKAREMQDA